MKREFVASALRYLLVGLASTSINWCLVVLLSPASGPSLPVIIVAWAAGIWFSSFMQVVFVFRAEANIPWRKRLYLVGMYFFLAVLNYLGVVLLQELSKAGLALSQAITLLLLAPMAFLTARKILV